MAAEKMTSVLKRRSDCSQKSASVSSSQTEKTWDHVSFKRNTATFWEDESGVISTIDYLILLSLLGIGLVTGLSEVRSSLVQVMGDISGSLENLNQSYSFTVAGTTSQFTDSATGADVASSEPQGISVRAAAASE